MTGERGDPEKQGLIPNSFDHIFSHITQTHDEQYLVRVSYLEIYKVREPVLSFFIYFSPLSGGGEGSTE